MEPNNIETNINMDQSKKSKSMALVIVGIVIVVLGVGGFFAYKYVYFPTDGTNSADKIEKAKKARILALQDRIAKAGDLPVSLTEEEYDLLLSEPVLNPDVEGMKTIVEGITVAFNYDDYFSKIGVALPFIPNIEGDDKIFVRIDSVLTNDGTDIIDRESGLEDENDMHTEIRIEKSSSEGKLYWLGDRNAHLTKEDITNDEIQKISGKIIIYLPINAQSLTLGPSDKGVKKSFVGGFLTLDDINLEEGTVSFTFIGKDNFLGEPTRDLFGDPLAYNKDGNLVGFYSYTHGSGGNASNIEFQDQPITSILFSGSESIVMKEIPFTIINTAVKSVAEVSDSKSTTTDIDKEAVIKAFFDFGKILDTKDPVKFVEYLKKAQPESADEIQKELADTSGLEEIKSVMDMMKVILFEDGSITANSFQDPSTVWTKADDGTLEVKVTTKTEDGSSKITLNFVKQDDTWYVMGN